jgi:integrase
LLSQQSAAAVFDTLDVAGSTRTDYKWRIQAFFAFLDGQPLTTQSYLDYKRYLRGRTELSISTKNKYLVAAGIFLRELNRRGLLPMDITLNIHQFQQSKKHKQDGLNDQEMTELAAWLRQLEPTAANARLRAIICLLALQGLRQIEVRRLDVVDVDLTDGVALVQGKGRDDKEAVDLTPQTIHALKDYLKVTGLRSGPLFPSREHKAGHDRITTRTIRLIVRQAFDELGIDKTTHGLRHYFTTKLLPALDGDLLKVRQYTRHTGLEMLRVYDDRRKQQEDLPRFYKAFAGVDL